MYDKYKCNCPVGYDLLAWNTIGSGFGASFFLDALKKRPSSSSFDSSDLSASIFVTRSFRRIFLPASSHERWEKNQLRARSIGRRGKPIQKGEKDMGLWDIWGWIFYLENN